jgi:hypothetical protein
MLFAFLDDPKGLAHWVEVTAHIPNTLAQALVQAFVAVVIVGAVLRPLLRRISGAWAQHHALHERDVKAHEAIADALNSKTPGGISDLILATQAIGAQRRGPAPE